MNRFFLLQCAAGAGALLALAVLSGCVAPDAVRASVKAEVAPVVQAQVGLQNTLNEVGTKVGEIKARDVNASTNNWSTPALIIAIGAPTAVLLVVLVGIGYLGAKAVGVKFGIMDWIDRMRFKRNGG